MKIRTKLTEMLGVDYPILLGGIKDWGRHELASAVSNAGCFGLITAINDSWQLCVLIRKGLFRMRTK